MDETQTTRTPSKAKPIIVFWTRMLSWIAFSCVIPILVFAYKFGLFKKDATEVDSLGNVIAEPSVALNGWGIVACILVGFTVLRILKEIIATFPKYSFAKQCYIGFTKTVMPLLICFGVCVFLQGCIAQVTFCLGTIIICQCVAIPLNPLPKWRYERAGVEDYSDAIAFLTDFVKSKKKEG